MTIFSWGGGAGDGCTEGGADRGRPGCEGAGEEGAAEDAGAGDRERRLPRDPAGAAPGTGAGRPVDVWGPEGGRAPSDRAVVEGNRRAAGGEAAGGGRGCRRRRRAVRRRSSLSSRSTSSRRRALSA